MRVDEGDNATFMTMLLFSDDADWKRITQMFFEHVDSLPHHYYMHLMHGAQIIGYKHRISLYRERWNAFYLACCSDCHVVAETEVQMDRRLNDWERKFWDVE